MLQRWGAGRGSSEKLQLQPAAQRLRMLWQRLRGAVQWRGSRRLLAGGGGRMGRNRSGEEERMMRVAVGERACSHVTHNS